MTDDARTISFGLVTIIRWESANSQFDGIVRNPSTIFVHFVTLIRRLPYVFTFPSQLLLMLILNWQWNWALTGCACAHHEYIYITGERNKNESNVNSGIRCVSVGSVFVHIFSFIFFFFSIRTECAPLTHSITLLFSVAVKRSQAPKSTTHKRYFATIYVHELRKYKQWKSVQFIRRTRRDSHEN